MQRISCAVFAALAVATLTVGCEKKAGDGAKPAAGGGEATATQPATPTPPASDDTILIGEVSSLTGPEATFGLSTHNGILLALAEVNAAGGIKGKKVAVRTYDDQSKPEEAANAMTRLITQDKVKLVLGEVASSNSLAMADKAQPAKIPMISPSSTAPEVTEKGDYIFRVCFIDPFQGFVMAKFAKENLKLNQVVVLKDVKSAYSLGLAEVFIKKFSEMGGKVLDIQSYSKGDTDFRAQLTALKQLKPEGIYVPGYYSDVGVIAKQARELGLKVPLMGGDGWDSPKLFELGGSAIEGSYFSNHYSSQEPEPRVQAFLKNFAAANKGEVPDALAALGYDAANVALDAMKKAPDLTGPALRDAIAATKDFPGIAGSITLDAKRNPVKPAVVLQVADGKYKYVATITP